MPEFRPVPPHADHGVGMALSADSSIPPIEEPTAVFVAQADTALHMARMAVRHGRRNPRLWAGMAAIVVPLTALMFLAFGPVALLGVPLLTAGPFVAGMFWPGLSLRKALERGAGRAEPGQVMAIRFGAAEFDLHQADRRLRIRYDEIRGGVVDTKAVLLGHEGLVAPLPRELFPEWAIDILSARVPRLRGVSGLRSDDLPELPVLPELPPLAYPAAVFAARPDTAPKLNTAYYRRVTKDFGKVLAFLGGTFSLPLLLAGMWMHLLAYITAVLVGVALLLWKRSTAMRERAVSLLRYASAGQRIAIRFTPDAIDIHSAVFHFRTRYADMQTIDVQGDAVSILTPGILFTLPRELFTEHALGYLRSIMPAPKRR